MAEAARDRAVCLTVVEETQVGAARRRAAALADAFEFDEVRAGKLGVIVTEAATNLVQHATGGTLILQPIPGERAGLDVVAVDRGPGMADPARCLQDGYSTAGTRGQGLGAIRRQADEFDIDSKVGVGSVVVARIWRDARQQPTDTAVRIGGVCTPILDEEHVGDAWGSARFGTSLAIVVADGLGHGIEAERASRDAVRIFVEAPDAPVTRTLERANEALRSGRGAAVAVARIQEREVRFAGVGNVAGAVIEGATVRHMVSHNGIVGHQMPRAQEFSYPWTDRSLLVLASDGVRTQWRLDAYPGIARRHPTLLAATIWRDFSRGRDDATVVVAQGPALR
ncbi:MAG TPA: ATP-binding protein [Gemmatimonadaceae bacterium]|nr:ATP-binding protein [Gemmatimonadaceae bacterium]